MPIWNRAPLAANAFAQLPPGSIQAHGWLHTQLRLSADGLTGRMMDIWPDVGPNSGWLGGSGENWERGPYYVRGLLSLAHALRDHALLHRAQPWIDWALQSQRDDGFFGPRGNDDWWARMPMLDALRWHDDATGDRRVLTCMTNYMRYQLAQLPHRPLEMWGKPRGGENTDAALWLYNRTGDPFLLDLADLLHQQTSDWIGELGADGAPDETFEFGHGVNRAMGFKEPVVYWQRSGQARHTAVLHKGWQRILAHHGQIHGLYSGDEFLHGHGPTQGTELCTVVELLHSFETALKISGEPWIADAIERIAYNALPAMLSADHHSHQYFQLPNQVECTRGNRNFSVPHETDLLFGVETGYGCCAANFHMGWPQLVHHLWLATRAGGLAAMLFAPCTVTTTLADGQRVAIAEETAYPFGEDVHFTIRCQSDVCFPLQLHIPAWAPSVGVCLNGTAIEPRLSAAGSIDLARSWQDGDTVSLHVPMPVRLSHWERNAVAVERGPLVYALRIGEEWRRVGGHAEFPDCEVHPTTPWNYALRVDRADVERSLRVESAPLAEQPWAQDGASTRLSALGHRLPEWTVMDGVSGPIPERCAATAAVEPLTLIPYGCARLRISMFPTIDAT